MSMTQTEALAILESGASTLVTGAAGTGKTYLINQFIKRAKKRGKHVAITATTGLAATHLNGTTIHAWSGMGVHDELPAQFITKLGKQRRGLIEKANILIIDEISIDEYCFRSCRQIAQKIFTKSIVFYLTIQ